MAKKIKKDNEEVVAQPAATPTRDASGDFVFVENLPARSRMTDVGDDDVTVTGDDPDNFEIPTPYLEKPKVQSTTTYTPPQQTNVVTEGEQTSDDDLYLRYLNSELRGATARTKTAQGNYDKAYEAVGSELGAVAKLLKPKEREPERKRIRNVAMGQAIGQALAAIFGGAYANNKKTGYGKIVLPEDFASKTLSRAEELREKGLLEDKEYRRLLSDMNLRKAELGLQRATGELTNARANERFVQKLIGDYHQQTRKLAGEAAAREATAQENATDREWRGTQNALNRESNERIAKLRADATRAAAKGRNINFDVDNITDDEWLLIGEMLPKSETRNKTAVDDTGRRTNETVSTKKESWSKDEYASTLTQARMFMRRHSEMAEFVDSGKITWVDVKRYVEMSDADKDRELNDLIKAGKATVAQVNALKAAKLPKEWIIAKLSTN